MQAKTISPLKLYLTLLGFFFVLMALFRLIFWAVISRGMAEPLSLEVLQGFYIGLRFDARIAALITLPFGIAACIPPLIRRLHTTAKAVTAVYVPVIFAFLLIYCVDLGFYFYLGSRVTRVLFELLEDVNEAVGMVWQSYPVIPIALGLVLSTTVLSSILYRLISVPAQPVKGIWRKLKGFLLGFLVFALAVYGQINSSLFPLRWSNAFFTTNEKVIALGLNPIQSLYDTYGSDSSGFSRKDADAAYPAISSFLQVDSPDREHLNYLRSLPAREGDRPKLNVVIIIMESLAYPKTSFAPGRRDPTPRIKQLARESLLFHRYFANARTTARAVFSVMTGIPDVNVGSTSSRNPMVADQRVVGNEFSGYAKYYLIGGNTNWANIRAVLAQNITDLHIFEENYWKAPRVDVWGVSDYDLMQEAHTLFTRQREPFLAVIQTASYHKPYTIPPTPGFEPEEASDADLKQYGFEDNKEYNSMRYSDYALGEFMRQAKQADYYKNTVFFIFGDHGLNDPCENMPESYQAAGLAPWHVPLLIHASPDLDLFEPGESYMPCSHADIFPTAAGLARIPYNNWTMGRDIFDTRFDGSRIVYIGGKKTEGIRLVYGDYCFFDNLLGSRHLYRITDNPATDLADKEQALFRSLSTMSEYMDATIRYMLFNNKKGAGRTPPATAPQPR